MMTLVAWILAGAAAQSQPATVYCSFFEEGESIPAVLPGDDGWDARIRFQPEGTKKRTAFLVGPPLFSSSKGLTSYSAGGSGGISKTEAKVGPWNVSRFDVTGFALERGKSTITLSQSADRPGHFTGAWNISDKLDGMVMEASGPIGCEVLDQDVSIRWDRN